MILANIDTLVLFECMRFYKVNYLFFSLRIFDSIGKISYFFSFCFILNFLLPKAESHIHSLTSKYSFEIRSTC